MWVRLKEAYRSSSISNSTGFAIKGNEIVKVPGNMSKESFPAAKFDLFETFEDAQKGIVISDKKPIAKPEPIVIVPKKIYTRQELEELSYGTTFSEFRDWIKKEFKVTGRNTAGLIQDALDVQSGKKLPELKG